MNVLHITHHDGCKYAVDFMCQKLGHQITTQHANWTYNISKTIADTIWKSHKDYFNLFDCIITSDTAPLSRIFIREEYTKKLIIWVCNRFDYADKATADDFPDAGFYNTFKQACNKQNTVVRSYTKFEHEYAKKYRRIEWCSDTLKPCIEIINRTSSNTFHDGQIKLDTFFVTRYHNDNILLNLKAKCSSLGINAYCGTYDGPADLIGIRGIIHIPYAWSNLALFENWSIGNVYFIPSKKFLLELRKGGNFFWSPPFDEDLLESSEWYLPEHRHLFVYFDSFEQLRTLSKNDALIAEKRKLILDFSAKHTTKTLNQWKIILDNI